LISRAVILAGGRGTRLTGLTKYLPKTLLRLPDGALIDYLIRYLLESGIAHIYVSVGHLGRDVAHHICSRFPQCHVLQQKKPGPTAADGLLCMEHVLDDDFIVVHGDHFFSQNPFKELANTHRAGTITFPLQRTSYAVGLSNELRCHYDHRSSRVRYYRRGEKAASTPLKAALIDGCIALPQNIFTSIRACRREAHSRCLDMNDTFRFIDRKGLLPMFGVEIPGWWANVNDFKTYAMLLKRFDAERPPAPDHGTT
jgi:NDP-sugar pyrophosphorylase family protein